MLFCWTVNGRRHVGEGLACNISADGMFVASSKCPPNNSAVQCQLLLPALQRNAAAMKCTLADIAGHVLRGEVEEDEKGFAVQCRRFVLREEVIDGEQWRRLAFREN